MKWKVMAVLTLLLFAYNNGHTINLPHRILYVGGSGAGNYTSIQDAIDNATDGDIIFVYSGIYNESIFVNKTLRIYGEDRETTIINGMGGDVAYLAKDGIEIKGFTIMGSGGGMRDAGIEMHSSFNHIHENIITGNEIGILAERSHFNDVYDNLIQSNSYGIRIFSSGENRIYNNTIESNGEGIWLDYSQNTRIYENTFIQNGESMLIHHLSNFTRIYNNSIEGGKGIRIFASQDNQIHGNIISSTLFALYLQNASSNTIYNNSIYENSYGIYSESSSSNTIYSNLIERNTYGISLSSSSSNLIYNNYFNNTVNAKDNGYNTWNISKAPGTNIINGPYLGGNYWNDYNGIDTNNDTIGDTMLPYNCNSNIIHGGDWLPLTRNLPPPSIHIVKPAPSLYIWDREVMKLHGSTAIAIGGITIETRVESLAGIDRVEFYIDKILKHVSTHSPYSWKWDERALFRHIIEVVAYDNAGKNDSDAIEIIIFNL